MKITEKTHTPEKKQKIKYESFSDSYYNLLPQDDSMPNEIETARYAD